MHQEETNSAAVQDETVSDATQGTGATGTAVAEDGVVIDASGTAAVEVPGAAPRVDAIDLAPDGQAPKGHQAEYDPAPYASNHRGNVDIFMGPETTLDQLDTAFQNSKHQLVMRGSYPLESAGGNPIQAFPGGVYLVHGIDVRLASEATIRTLQGMAASPPPYATVPGTYSAIRLDTGREGFRDGVAPIDLLRIVLDDLKTGVGETADAARRHIAEAIKCFE